jgi:hypothetical protein
VASQLPFELPEKRSLIRYSQTFQRLLCYIIRAAPEEPGEDSETGVTFSAEQWICIQNVREMLKQLVAVEEAETEDYELTMALMGLIITLITQDTSQLLLYESPVMHYLAVRSVNPQTERFYPSFQYTPTLAHMI